MRSLWPTVIAPLLAASRPSAIVDFGADEAFSAFLEEAAREYGASVHGGGEDLAGAAAPQLAFVHGEPNWHAVSERLDRLDAMARAGGAPLALTLVHGVDWPTGRRDAYPNPAAVPVGARQPHRPEGGVERALDAHDLRNGVLTAVEDFLAGAEDELELVHVPGFGGTAILVPSRRIEDGDSPLSRLIDGWRLGPQVLAQLAAIEAKRVGADATIADLRSQLEAARAGETVLTAAEEESRREHLERLAERVAELSEALARRDARLARLTAAAAVGADATAVANPPSASPAAEALGGFSQPLPLDRHRILLGEGDEAPASGPPPLHAIVRARGDVGRLRRCLWSLLAGAERPLRLTLATEPGRDEFLDDLVRAVAVAEPRVRVVAGDPEDDPTEWRLRVENPVEFGHGAIRNLLAAAGQATPSPVAACSPEALGVPAWAGPDCLPLLLAGETLEEAGIRFAAPCVALAPGAKAGPAAAVALDAAASGGQRAGDERDLGPLAWLGETFGDESALAAGLSERLSDPLAIAYVLPGLPAEGSGGSHSIFEEALALAACGARARVLVEAEFADRARLLYPAAAALVEPYRSPRELTAGLGGFDVAVATEAPSARLVAEHVRGRDVVVGAYYVQDYEPLFSPAGGPSADAALLSYRYAEGLLLFAKTHWLGNVVATAHEVPVAKVSASLNHSLFNTGGRRSESKPVRILAMVRPRTPRRRPAQTLAALARLQRELGDRVECLSFGCTTTELESLPAAGVDHLGTLSRADVAEVLRRCDLFLDLSAYQAFGRTGLEAMACGAVPILPRSGGAEEYAVDDWNAVLVDTADEDAALAAARALVADPARIDRLRANGVQTVRRFSATRAAVSQYACFAARRRALREAP